MGLDGHEYLQHALGYLRCTHQEVYCNPLPPWNVIHPASGTVPQQANTWDCGIFVCSYIHQILMDQWPSWSQAIISEYRWYIAYCIIQSSLLPPDAD